MFFFLKILECLLFLFHIVVVFIRNWNLQAEIVVSLLEVLYNCLNSVVFGLVTIKTTTKQLSTVCEL